MHEDDAALHASGKLVAITHGQRRITYVGLQRIKQGHAIDARILNPIVVLLVTFTQKDCLPVNLTFIACTCAFSDITLKSNHFCHTQNKIEEVHNVHLHLPIQC